MVALAVNMDAAKVREALAKVSEALAPEACAAVCAEAGADVVRAHLERLASSRHRPGQRLNFYLQAADSVLPEASGAEARIRIPHTGMAQRYHGGVIRPSGRVSPVTGKPVTRLAVGIRGTPGEGHTPADFGELFVAVRKGSKKGEPADKGAAYLARDTAAGVQYLFTLLARVRQQADPSVLPADADILDAAAEAIADLADAAQEKTP